MHMQLRRHAASNLEPHASLIAGPRHNADPKSQPTNQTTDEPMDGERETDPPPPVAAAATGCTPTTSRGSSTASSCSSNSHPSAPASTGTPPSAVVPWAARAGDSCYYPGCRKDANCACEMCLASIDATRDLVRAPEAASARRFFAPPPAGAGGPRSSAATAAPGRGPSSPSRRRRRRCGPRPSPGGRRRPRPAGAGRGPPGVRMTRRSTRPRFLGSCSCSGWTRGSSRRPRRGGLGPSCRRRSWRGWGPTRDSRLAAWNTSSASWSAGSGSSSAARGSPIAARKTPSGDSSSMCSAGAARCTSPWPRRSASGGALSAPPASSRPRSQRGTSPSSPARSPSGPTGGCGRRCGRATAVPGPTGGRARRRCDWSQRRGCWSTRGARCLRARG
ncbi:hypothetical protein PVAP13_9NG102873 [Panicum virgatum]|uniref:Uncharacterized protein n=1 Tax=Panicum virgatum TaxID=38727 RepID=A0A8T0MDA3_PANVG|nr:hypothetical protein PVAP13_9NG102873 [Panicum virgatum]